MNPSIAAQQYESTSIPLNPGHWTKTGTTNRLLQKNQTKRLKHNSGNDTGCNEQWPMHDTTQPNTWQGAIHNPMVTIKIWMHNRISRVTWVSGVRQLQIWLKNFYQWSRKWMRYEEQHYHKINTQSITKYMNVKMCLSPFCNENMSIESKIEPRIKQRMRY